MQDLKVLLSVPATIYDFGETQNLTNNKYVTHAKLKVFYVGKTADYRVFTKQFSDQLLKTLPGTPVVAYYDEDKDDFVGHHITQHVFGYVPEQATIEYIEEDGVTFALTDVLLFTGRNDNIGVIANKIIGHPHSLELDPNTIEYTLVKAKGSNKIESLTFTRGDFVGLSVLGSNEKPAFTGSAFFHEENGSELEAFIDSFIEFKKEVELFKSGGQTMNENTEILNPTSYQDFMTSTLTEKITNVTKVLEANGFYGYFIDEIDGKFIFRTYNTADDSYNFHRFSMVDNVITAMEVVYPRYLTESEINSIGNASEVITEEVTEEVTEVTETAPIEDAAAVEEVAVVEVEITQEETQVEDAEVIITENETNDNPDNEVVAQTEVIEGIEDVGTKEQTEKIEVDAQIANSAALNDAERQELDEYRKQAKFELIETYDQLSEETKNKYRENHAKYSVEDLDKELAFELVTSQRQTKKRGVRVFSSIQPETNRPKTVLDLIEKYKDHN